jgi:hypothetical protein
MKIVREHINERMGFTEDSDPVADMGIGFIAKLKNGINAVKRDDEFSMGPIITRISYRNGNLICNTKFTLPDDAPYFKHMFSKHGLGKYFIFNASDSSYVFGTSEKPKEDSYETMIKIKPQYKRYFKKILEQKSITEKFEADSDPIADMGIGGIDLLQYIAELEKESSNKTREFLSSLIGKFISGFFRSGTVSTQLNKEGKYTFYVSRYTFKTSKTNPIQITLLLYDDRGSIYYVYGGERYFISDKRSNLVKKVLN